MKCNRLRNQERSDSSLIHVWLKSLFVSVGAIFLKIYSLIPNVAKDLPTTCIWWSKGSTETLMHKTGKNFVLLAGLQKMTEINAQINLRDINNKHDPSQALPRVRSHHTLMLTEGAVDWPSSSISQNQEGRGHLGEELRRQNSVGFSVYSLLLCVVLCFVFQIPFFKYNVHSPSCSGLAPAFFTYHPLLEVIAFCFWVFILAWLYYGCYPSVKWGAMLFLLTT